MKNSCAFTGSQDVILLKPPIHTQILFTLQPVVYNFATSCGKNEKLGAGFAFMGREYRLQAGNKGVFLENEDSANTPERRFYHLPPCGTGISSRLTPGDKFALRRDKFR